MEKTIEYTFYGEEQDMMIQCDVYTYTRWTEAIVDISTKRQVLWADRAVRQGLHLLHDLVCKEKKIMAYPRAVQQLVQ